MSHKPKRQPPRQILAPVPVPVPAPAPGSVSPATIFMLLKSLPDAAVQQILKNMSHDDLITVLTMDIQDRRLQREVILMKKYVEHNISPDDLPYWIKYDLITNKWFLLMLRVAAVRVRREHPEFKLSPNPAESWNFKRASRSYQSKIGCDLDLMEAMYFLNGYATADPDGIVIEHRDRDHNNDRADITIFTKGNKSIIVNRAKRGIWSDQTTWLVDNHRYRIDARGPHIIYNDQDRMGLAIEAPNNIRYDRVYDTQSSLRFEYNPPRSDGAHVILRSGRGIIHTRVPPPEYSIWSQTNIPLFGDGFDKEFNLTGKIRHHGHIFSQ
jgi:hypothetical protein